MLRREKIRRWGREALDFLFPTKCVLCRAYGAVLCNACSALVPAGPLFFCPVCTDPVGAFGWCPRHKGQGFISGAVALGSYDNPGLAALVRALKYEGAQELGAILGGRLAELVNCGELILSARGSWHAESVPLHRRRLVERDYNQAELIARGFVATAARLDGLPAPLGRFVLSPILRRRAYTTPQAQLSGEARRKNIVGAFRSVASAQPEDGYILIDDVATTGATLAACSEALHNAGARTICALVVARG